MKTFLTLSLSDVVFIMLINVKTPTIVGILTFMSRINFVLSSVEHGKCFKTSGPVFGVSDQVILKPVNSATESSWNLEIAVSLAITNNTGADQTAQMPRLVCAFVVFCMQQSQVF